MGSYYQSLLILSTLIQLGLFVSVFVNCRRVLSIQTRSLKNGTGFDKNYMITWGDHHVSRLDGGTTIQLLMDKSCGAGFGSKVTYSSGYFHMRMKLPDGDCAGVVTAFYLTSHDNKLHDEIDFEFLGNREGKPYELQTNIFVNGKGKREQKTHLWFDPRDGFHTYKILWNSHQIVFFVDTIPIRFYMNDKTLIGDNYPTKRPMQIVVSLWDGDSWATDGGKTKTNWTAAPFKAYFRSFDVHGCPWAKNHTCNSTNFWWNKVKYWKLGPQRRRMYEAVRKYRTYDYCTDKQRFRRLPPECRAEW